MTLLLHVLVLSFLSGGSAKVLQQGFEKECDKFFAGGIPPTRFSGSQYKQICQTLNDVAHYATYYDTHNKIPVYTAYKFEGIMGCDRKKSWYIEPQLDMKADMKASNMASEGSVDINLRGDNQALNEDYRKSESDKGHLAPVFQANSQACADATFTLTNAAPQNPSFNRGQWRGLEENMAKTLSEQCKKYTVYIVTGVTPGTTKNLNNRVNVPSHFWTAYCCLDQNNKCQISGGFIGENENNTPRSMTVNDLETNLAKLYNIKDIPFKVFHSSTAPQSAKKRKIEPSK